MKTLSLIVLLLVLQNLSGQTETIDTTYMEASTISKDGTKIGYRTYGQGPGLILVQGAMGTMYNYHELAKALSKDFTVYVPERRGRGISPKEFSSAHTIASDVEDLKSIMDISGATYVFGLSSGAIITLEATKVLPAITKAAIYEPPFYVNDAVPVKKINSVFEEISEGNLSNALARVFKIVKVGPAIFNYVPLPILKLMTKAFIKSENRQEQGNYEKIEKLIPAMRYDFTAVLERGGQFESYRSIDRPILLLGGSKSPKYLKEALDSLEEVLPNAERIEFKKRDHNAPWNADRGGSPELVAKALIEFFTKTK